MYGKTVRFTSVTVFHSFSLLDLYLLLRYSGCTFQINIVLQKAKQKSI